MRQRDSPRCLSHPIQEYPMKFLSMAALALTAVIVLMVLKPGA